MFIENAKLSITKWNGKFINYYSEYGVAFVDVESAKIRTAFYKEKFDENAKKIMELVNDDNVSFNK